MIFPIVNDQSFGEIIRLLGLPAIKNLNSAPTPLYV